MIYIEKLVLMLFIIIVIIFMVINSYEYKTIIYDLLLTLSLTTFFILLFKEFKPIKKLLLNIIKLPLSFINKLLSEENIKTLNQEQNSILHDEIYKKTNEKKIEPILNIIKTHQEKKFFSMALIGKWGIGKSSYLYNLKKELQQDNYEVVYINVWELENLSNIIKEIEKEFDNILFNNSLLLWINKLFYSILGKDYFSIVSKYFTKNSINLDVGLTPTLNEAKKHYNSLLNQAISKKIILCIDEVDRLNNKDEILNIFKIIRYLTSFDCVFTITAIDIEQLENKLDNIEYIHKIFNIKYILPKHTKSELIDFLKKDIYNGLKDFINKKDFEKLIDFREPIIKQTIISVFNNYREIKNSFNDTYLMFQTLKSQNTEWNQYIRWEFIFILSIIKSTNFNMYLKIMKNTNMVTIFDNLHNKDKLKEKLIENDTNFKDIFENFYQEFDKSVLTPLFILRNLLLSDIRNFEQYLYIYRHYKLYDFLITNELYEKITNDENTIDNKLNQIHLIEEKREFLLRLIEMIYRDTNTTHQFKILKKIIEVIQRGTNLDSKKLIEKIVNSNLVNKNNEQIFKDLILIDNNQDILFILIDLLIDRLLKGRIIDMDSNIIISLIKLYLENNNNEIAQEKNLDFLEYLTYKSINLQNDIHYNIKKLFHDYYKNTKYKDIMIHKLLLSVWSSDLKELFKKLKINIDDCIQDSQEYQIWLPTHNGYSTEYINGKELKENFLS